MTMPTRCVNPDCPAFHSVIADSDGECPSCGRTREAIETEVTDYPETRIPDSNEWWTPSETETESEPGPAIPPAPWNQAVGSTFAGRYKILRKLGQGGMGAVYQVHDANLDRVVALKIPSLAGAGPDFIKRFLREARAMAKLGHAENICNVLDVVNPRVGVPYLTMEYVDGITLSEKIRKEGRLPIHEAVRIVKVLAGTLGRAHDLNITHRDLKPANIMIRGDGRPIVMDFGLARRDGDERITLTNTVMGTLPYMAPEQVMGQVDSLGPASDIYSLGVIFYEALTGVKPFTGPESVLVGRILTAEPAPPSSHRPDVLPRIDEVCLKALAKLPEARQASMAILAEELDGIVKPEEVETETSRPIESPEIPATQASRPEGLAKGSPASDGTSRRPIGRPIVVTGLIALASVAGLAFFLSPAPLPAPSVDKGSSTVALAGGATANSGTAGPGQAKAGKGSWPPIARAPRGLLTSPTTGMILAPVDPGVFEMGSNRGEVDELPVHTVAIQRPFYLGKFEVKQVEYKTVSGEAPSRFVDDVQRPVERVSWFDAVRFCNALSSKDRLRPFYAIEGNTVTVADWSASGYRLPTEAEWEFACRAGRVGEYGSRDHDADLPSQGWYNANSKLDGKYTTFPKGPRSSRPHPLGLENMQGNVREWCWDFYAPSYPAEGTATDPTGPVTGSTRVLRGGFYNSLPKELRPSARHKEPPDVKSQTMGFRVARSDP
jgi:serine/threonine protein kinase/formylglycine-generating enzyme required for sulfatase activity